MSRLIIIQQLANFQYNYLVFNKQNYLAGLDIQYLGQKSLNLFVKTTNTAGNIEFIAPVYADKGEFNKANVQIGVTKYNKAKYPVIIRFVLIKRPFSKGFFPLKSFDE